MRPGGVGLRTRFIALLLATLIPLAGLGGYWLLSDFREERARIRHEVQETAALIAAQVGHSVAGVQERLAVLARLPAVRTGNRREIERLFQDLLADAPHLENLGLVAPDGTVMVSAVPLPSGRPVSLGDREWLQRVVRWGEPADGGFQVGRITGNPNVILANPVLDEQGRLTAVIYAAFNLAYASLAVTWAYPGVPLLWAVVDEQGLVLLHSRPETTSGKPLGPLPLMLRGETLVPGTRWHCVVVMPADMATAQVRDTFLRVGLPAGLILLISAAVGLWIAYNTWRPIRDLTSAVRRVGTGESTVQIPVHAGGELGVLAATFAETLAAVDRRRGELAALVEAGRAIASSLDLEQSLQAIVQQAAIISGVNFVRLLLLDEEAQVLRCGAVSGLPPEEERNVIIPIVESFSGQVVATHKPLAVADTRGDPRNSHAEHSTKYGLVSYLGLPVKLGDRILGVLVFNTTSPRTYSHDEIAYLSAFADQAAVAIENARLFQEEQARRRQLEAVRAVTTEITRELDLNVLLGLIIRRAAELTGTGTGTVYLWDEEAQALFPRAWHGHGEWIRGLSLRLGQGVVGTAAQRREGLIVNDYRTSPYAVPMTLEHTRITANLAEPLLYRDRLLGVIGLDNEITQRPFTQEDRGILALFAVQAAIAIENAQLYEATQRELAERARTEAAVRTRTQQLETVRAIGEEIIRELDLRAVLDLIMRRAVELVGTSSGMLRLWDQEAGLLVPQSWVGLDMQHAVLSLRLGEGVAGTAAERRQGLVVNDFRHSPYATPLLLERTTHPAVLAEPLLYRDRLIGVINLNREEPGRPFTEDDRQLLALFAAQAAIAIENARLLQEERDRRRQLEAVRVVTEEIARELDLSAVLGLITRGAAGLMGTSFGAVYLWDEATEVLTPRAWHGFGDWMSEVRLRPGEAVAGVVAQRREGMIINDLPTSPYGHPLFVERSGIIAVLAEPLLYRDRLVGVIAIGTDKHEQPFTPQHRETLALFAAQAAIAIEKARLYGEALEKTERLEGLTRTSAKVAGTLRLEDLLDAIVEEAAKLLRAEGAGFRLLEGDRLVVASRYGLAHYTTLTPSLRIGESLAGLVAQQGRPLMVPDQREDSQILVEHRTAAAAHGAVAYLGVPVRYRDRIIGVLHVDGKERRTFSEEEIRLLSAFADHAAIAIENARLHEAAVRRSEELGALLQATHSVMSGLDLQAILERIVAEAAQISGCPHLKLLLVDREAGLLRIGVHTGTSVPDGFPMPVGTGLSGIVAQTGQPLFIPNTHTDPRSALGHQDQKLGMLTYLGLPIKIRDEVLGVLTFNTAEPRQYSTDELAYLTSFADQAAIALANARMYEAAVRRGEELQAMLRAARTVMSGLDLQGTLDRIIREAAQISGIPHVKVVLVDKEERAVRFAAAVGRPAEMFEGFAVPLGTGTSGLVAATGEPLFIADCQNDPRNYLYADQDRKLGIQTYLGLPIKIRDEVLGVLTFNTTEPHEYSSAELTYLASFADQAAIAIENARLYEAARRAAQEAQSLYEVGHSLTTSLDPREVLHLISVKTTELLGTPHAQVVLWDEETKTLRLGAAYGTEAEKVKQQVFRLGEGVNGIVAEARKPLFVNDYQRFPKGRPDMTDLVAVIGVPLLYRGRLLGVLTSHATQAGTIFTEDHLALLTSFANQAAIAIENARLYEEIRRHAEELETRVRQRTAELEEALRVKVEFLGKMSHELRTPLNFILGFSDLLQQGTGGPLTPKQATYLDRIQGGGRRLLSLVTDVLDIAQLDAGKSRLRLEPVILPPLVQEVLGLVQIPMSQKRLKVTTALDPWMPFFVADRLKLVQILHNLVGNAVKFTPEGGSIRLTTRQVPGNESTGAGEHGSSGESAPQPPGATAPQQFVEITVEDTGIGIRPENLETVFEAFYQVDGSETRAQGGTGLGLALVRKLVELHGGWVWAESPGPGQGSRFIVRLPRLEVPKAKRILLVEDEALIRTPMASALESAGFAVVGVATGAEALAVMEAEAFDLLILDVVLPDMEGWKILQRVREVEEIRTLPVLVVTGLESLNAEQALALGADEFLTKPVSPRVLVDIVIRLLAQPTAQAPAETRPPRSSEEERDRGTEG